VLVCHGQLTHFVDYWFQRPLVLRHVQRVYHQVVYVIDHLLLIAEEQRNSLRHFHRRDLLLSLQQLCQHQLDLQDFAQHLLASNRRARAPVLECGAKVCHELNLAGQ
jgi:hypothetical protein